MSYQCFNCFWFSFSIWCSGSLQLCSRLFFVFRRTHTHTHTQSQSVVWVSVYILINSLVQRNGKKTRDSIYIYLLRRFVYFNITFTLVMLAVFRCLRISLRVCVCLCAYRPLLFFCFCFINNLFFLSFYFWERLRRCFKCGVHTAYMW